MSRMLGGLTRLGAILTTVFAPRGSDRWRRLEGQPVEALPAFVARLIAGDSPGRFMVVGIKGSDDFLNLEPRPEGLRLVMPMVTERQRCQREAFEQAAAFHGMIVEEVFADHGNLFREAEIDGGAARAAHVLKDFLSGLFDLRGAGTVWIEAEGLAPAQG
ncbi:MAG: hypothetical protein AAF577_06535 [Pseudomonadota bacterium]